MPWNDPLAGGIVTTSDVTIDIVARASTGPITAGYIVTALYHTVNAMFQLQPGFFTCVTLLLLHGQAIGGMEISTQRQERSSIGDGGGQALTGNITVNSTIVVPEVDSTMLNSTLNENKENSKNTFILTESKVDPDDPKLEVEYEYGKVIQRSDLWSAVFDGIATGAQFEVTARCIYLTAVSISGNLVFHVNDLDNHLFTYQLAVSTFRLMALESMGSRIYKELEMGIFYDGTKVAEGYVLSLGKPLLVGDGEAVASER